jgi:MYXO-CTERM domain-containing protein
MKRTLFSFALVMAAFAGSAHAATVYSIANSFDAANNPNGPWTAAASTGLDFTPLSVAGGGSPIFNWHNPAQEVYFEQNTGATSTVDAYGRYWNPGDVTLHPGPTGSPSGEFAILRFTAPTAGAYDFNVGFTANTPATVSSSVFVIVDGNVAAPLHTGSVTTAQDVGLGIHGAGPTFTNSIVLAAGGTIDFVVGNGGNGHANDLTGINGSVTLVPEPTAALLATFGAAAIGAVRRRRD